MCYKKIAGSHSGKGYHYSNHHLSKATKLHECLLPLTWRPYPSSLSYHLPLHVTNNVTTFPTDFHPIATYEISYVHFPPPLALHHHFVHHLRVLHHHSNHKLLVHHGLW